MGTLETVVGVVAIGGIAAYFLIPEFKQQVEAALGGGGGGTTQKPTPPPVAATCSQLCTRRECSTYRSKCDPAACPNCNCAKMCSAGQCGSYRGAGCNPASCTGCAIQLGSKCPYAGCTNMIPGPGCFQCRCSGICKSKPGTYAVTDAKGSCFCRKLAAQAVLNPNEDRISIL